MVYTQTSLTREQKEAVGLLSIGTFLEYFDLMLYVHMAAFLNELFFEITDSHTASLMTAFAFSSTFILRPIGALIFGWLGDHVGRKITVIITTFMMAVSCVVMASLPTYAQIGITATWVATICRAIQGMSSMGEIVGATLYLTESINPPIQYTSIGFVAASSSLGEICALATAVLVTSCNFNWRFAFLIGAVVALTGSIARSRLRETPEFADAKRRIQKVFEKTNTDQTILTKDLAWTEKTDKKAIVAFFLLQCASPICFYFAYIYCGNILKTTFNYTTPQVIYHNFILCIIEFLTIVTLSYLSYKIYPLIILKVIAIIYFIFIVFCPYLLDNLHFSYEVYLFNFLSFYFV